MIPAALIFSLAAAIVIPVTAGAANIDADRLADAIRIREGWQGHDGAKGERGPYQITWRVWQDRMGHGTFAQARTEAGGRICALRQLVWISEQLDAAGIVATPFNIALAWNAGVGAVLAGKAPVSSYHYATDVENLYATP